MPVYELIYFNAYGRAEPIRQCFAYAGIKYTDTRLEFSEWQVIKNNKSKIPYGVLPVLLIDGKPLCESHAITRYVAEVAGLDGKADLLEVARLDQAYELCRGFFDAVKPYWLCLFGFNPEDPEILKAEVFLPAVEKYFPNIIELLRPNYIFGRNGITYVDLYWANIIEFYKKHARDVIEKYPQFMEQERLIKAVPKLQEYFATRPKCPF
ncbi:unnamed protein product [Bursaphelenchus xylophilus]|uniref:(pine wood nematode) hypothetical protein n=1 Tax=Bursaphelenchus xylophilus TaxID=6326 RepID=A0A1I7RQK0_BURXY|nr:unnamed protein product [Bursaphelenchus xylophilus]CAG9104707.1 unnamed protein product [Bursaphelenchus xylophilus]